jgi:hypothetical protein
MFRFDDSCSQVPAVAVCGELAPLTANLTAKAIDYSQLRWTALETGSPSLLCDAIPARKHTAHSEPEDVATAATSHAYLV